MASSSSQSQELNDIEQLLSKGSVGALEIAVGLGNEYLDKLEELFVGSSGAVDTQKHWIKSIRKLREKGISPRVVIGVVGNTGAGKSSMINALLDEQKLLPTSGMRACTASAIEISFNYSHDPQQRYCAEVEFITKQDWCNELHVLLQDILDGEGNVSPDCNLPDTIAGRAFAKVSAVYPQMTKDKLRVAKSDEMLQEPNVHRVLGLVQKLSATSAQDLCSELKKFVDSKDKNTAPHENMEIWPLIKVVRVYCKADALSTGAVIVDLPGSHDSNAARAAVADSYMQACSGLWIATAIHRAVDDKSAKDLLGDSFKRQLKLDGAFSAITFVCTKTDDLVVDEIIEHIDEKDLVRDLLNQINVRKGEQSRLQAQLDGLKQQKEDVGQLFFRQSQLQDKWDNLRSKLNNGSTVFRPTDSPKKRKRASGHGGDRKKSEVAHIGSEDSDSDDLDISSDDNFGDEESNRAPLTAEQIEIELRGIKSEKRSLSASQKDLQNQIRDIKKALVALKAAVKGMEYQVKSKCIMGRNKYVKAAIKNDFAMGLKELDQDAAMDQDEDAFNPDVSLRDYDQLGQDLPVFCISARTYHGLKGSNSGEKAGFQGLPAVELTEIPQLQQHVKRLTEAGRKDCARQFLMELKELLNSMNLWAAGAFEIGLAKEDQMNNERFVHQQLEQLRKSLLAMVSNSMACIEKCLQDGVHTALDKGAQTAATGAAVTAEKWGAHKSQDGIAYHSYVATCRRSGTFGKHNFNGDLLDPIKQRISQPWDKFFRRSIPQVLDEFSKSSRAALTMFHSDTLSAVPKKGASGMGIQALDQQLKLHEAALGAVPCVMRTMITTCKRSAHRALQPALREAMTRAYQACLAEKGIGSYKRMKTIMREHIEDYGDEMFDQAAEAVKDELGLMCQEIGTNLNESVEDLMERLQHDYLTVLAGKEQIDAERSLRKSLRGPLSESHIWFTELLRRINNSMSEQAPATSVASSMAGSFPVSDYRLPFMELRRETTPTYFATEGADDAEATFTPATKSWLL